MNRVSDDLLAEREAAGLAVKQFAPITTAWAFEAQPASSQPLEDFFLAGVKSCDLFVLIIGKTITDPVEKEWVTACDYGKPLLGFRKIGVEPDLRAAELIRSLGTKYDSFSDAADLRHKLRQALSRSPCLRTPRRSISSSQAALSPFTVRAVKEESWQINNMNAHAGDRTAGLYLSGEQPGPAATHRSRAGPGRAMNTGVARARQRNCNC